MATIPPTATVEASWVLSHLQHILSEEYFQKDSEQSTADKSQEQQKEKLRHFIQSVKDDITEKSTADMSTARIAEMFGLVIPSRRELVLQELKSANEPHEVPSELVRSLERLSHADHGGFAQVYAHMAVNLLLFECELVMVDKYRGKSLSSTTTSIKNTSNPTNPKNIPVRFFRELDLLTQISDPGTNKLINVSERADWVFGVGSDRDAVLPLFAVIIAESPESFAVAENRLLKYLGIIRQRLTGGSSEGSCFAQGLYTDGVRYTIMFICKDGKVIKSRLYDIYRPSELKSVYNHLLSTFDLWYEQLSEINFE